MKHKWMGESISTFSKIRCEWTKNSNRGYRKQRLRCAKSHGLITGDLVHMPKKGRPFL